MIATGEIMSGSRENLLTQVKRYFLVLLYCLIDTTKVVALIAGK